MKPSESAVFVEVGIRGVQGIELFCTKYAEMSYMLCNSVLGSFKCWSFYPGVIVEFSPKAVSGGCPHFIVALLPVVLMMPHG